MAKKDGLPVVRGLGRGSGTGDLFRGAVSFLARATGTSLRKSSGGHTVFSNFSLILVNVKFLSCLFGRNRRRAVISALAPAPEAPALFRGKFVHPFEDPVLGQILKSAYKRF